MTSSRPGVPTSSGPSRDPLCDRVQRALVGDSHDAASPEVREHARGCSECRFLAELSRDFSGSSKLDADAGPLAAFVEVLDRAVESGELVLSRYRLEARLGSGGQGVVYRAFDTETHETVALKLVRCRADRPEATAREVSLAHRIRHPGVCRVYHTERHGDVRLISMEFVGGGSLGQAIKDGLSPRARLTVFQKVCAAIQAAHQSGVLHLDIKPANVLFRSPAEPLVTDFGLSVQAPEGDEGRPLSTGGTPHYMAPEQRKGGVVDRRTDVYALGVLLKQLLPRPSLRLARAIRRATAEDPERRFADVKSLLAAVEGRRRPWTWAAWLAVTLSPVVLALALPSPPPVRAPLPPDFGAETLPADAWNVALHRDGPRPSLAASHEGTACARNLADLNDGATHYADWQRGFAFPGPRPICVNLDLLGYCGALREDARLCLMREGQRAQRLDLLVRQRDTFETPADATLGQLEPAGDCRADNEVVVTLDRPRTVFAVRAWYRASLPTSYGVHVDDGDGWRTVFLTVDNLRGKDEPYRSLPPSMPLTTEFPPVLARRVRFTVRCDTDDPANPGQPGQPVWLYELEVFSRVSRLEARWRHLLGR